MISLTFAILVVPAFASEALATVDIRSITCSEYLAMPAAPSSKFSAWMTGWFSYESRRTFVDFDLHRTNVTNVRGWCQSNPSASVMVGLEKSIGVTGCLTRRWILTRSLAELGWDTVQRIKIL
jgi:hypothetical protein